MLCFHTSCHTDTHSCHTDTHSCHTDTQLSYIHTQLSYRHTQLSYRHSPLSYRHTQLHSQETQILGWRMSVCRRTRCRRTRGCTGSACSCTEAALLRATAALLDCEGMPRRLAHYNHRKTCLLSHLDLSTNLLLFIYFYIYQHLLSLNSRFCA